MDEKSPVVLRLHTYLNYTVNNLEESRALSAKANFFLKKVLTELFAELEEAPPEAIEEAFKQASAAAYWVSTGQLIENMPMPPGFWDEVGMIPAAVIKPAAALESSQNAE